MSRNLRKYQIVLLGPALGSHQREFLEATRNRTEELGNGIWDSMEILAHLQASDFDNTAPVVSVWFGASPATPASHDLNALNRLITEAKIVVPVVEDLRFYTSLTPDALHEINGLQLDGSPGSLDRLVNTVLEALQLLRKRRRIFISYARRDSRAVARQLFGAFAERGYDVFLDTHSIPAASHFQHQLWHSMTDSDLVLLLDSNGVESSRWCRAEYERADALAIGVVRVLWPDRFINPATDAMLLSHPVSLSGGDFRSGSATPGPEDELTDSAIRRLGEAVEGFRARSIAARQANLVTGLKREAADIGVVATVQPNSHVIVQKTGSGGRPRKVAVVPIVGVPVSTNYHDAFIDYDEDPPGTDEQVVVYDRRGFLPSWVKHLAWLDGKLPVKGIDISEVPVWLSTL